MKGYLRGWYVGISDRIEALNWPGDRQNKCVRISRFSPEL